MVLEPTPNQLTKPTEPKSAHTGPVLTLKVKIEYSIPLKEKETLTGSLLCPVRLSIRALYSRDPFSQERVETLSVGWLVSAPQHGNVGRRGLAATYSMSIPRCGH
ncbi:hypothetical protein EVAR_44627_1 [Eumeta japonica]|uniref:Uncharacterized protein n=1 Tax=Eumeta variegata TaxID=151549 RepID=A0A4C1Z015_EUMVA|nr:hypothetical protein EVAR_44627_1 [Eumeta japonica]